jgi:hypothetical protein
MKASNGANLNWPQQLGLDNLQGCQPTGRHAWIFAIVNASVRTFLASMEYHQVQVIPILIVTC